MTSKLLFPVPVPILLPEHDGALPDVVVELTGESHVIAGVIAEWVEHFNADNVPIEQHSKREPLPRGSQFYKCLCLPHTLNSGNV